MLQKFFSGAILPFHVYNRGVDKRKIFMEDSEYYRFIFLMWVMRVGSPSPSILTKSNIIEAARNLLNGGLPNPDLYSRDHKPIVSIISWNLMPNHYHLLLTSKVANGISKYMSKIGDAYTKYFNSKHERSGRLFEGPYKSVEVRSDRYFNILLQYINFNHAELVEPEWKSKNVYNQENLKIFVDKYEWSAHRDYAGLRKSRLIDRSIAGKLLDARFNKENGLEDYNELVVEMYDEELDVAYTKHYFLE